MAKEKPAEKKSAQQKPTKKTKEDLGKNNDHKNTVIGIILLAISLIFLMSSVGFAGPAGEKIFEVGRILFGYGYYLVIIFLGWFSFHLLGNKQVSNVSKLKWFGLAGMMLSSHGLLEIILNGHGGGWLGLVLGYPFSSLFDVYASSVLLFALLVASAVITFEKGIDTDEIIGMKGIFGNLWKKKKVEDDSLAGPRILPPEEVVGPSLLPEVEPEKEVKPKETKKEEDEFIPEKQKFKISSAYVPPPISLLEEDKGKANVGDIKANANIIRRTLANFGIQVEMDEITTGPTVTRYALRPAEGVKLSRIVALQSDLGLALAAHPIRIEAPIPGKSLVGIEVPNRVKSTVGLANLMRDVQFTSAPKPLTVALGKGISGIGRFANIAKMPHALIAGATGSGKSVTIHALITSLLYRNGPEDLRFIFVDPKRVELTLYNKIPHLLTPVITDPKKAILALKWSAKEMDRRYNLLEENSVRDIESYQKNVFEKYKGDAETAPEKLPYIVIVIDELADIMQAYPRELEAGIVRLAQMSRAVGIHLILSTQRPSVNVITGLIKANVPARIALQVSSQIDSRTILDQGGAEKLLGAGDMLYLGGEMSTPERIQSAFITENEVKSVVKFIYENNEPSVPGGEIELAGNVSAEKTIFDSMIGGDDDDDDLYEDAREIVIEAKKASTSFLQRKLKVGYARAARLIDMLEERGVVGPGEGAKPREVLEALPDNSPLQEDKGL